MSPDISIPRGDSDSYTVSVFDNSTGTDIPVNLAGCKLLSTVKKKYEDNDNDAVIPLKTYTIPASPAVFSYVIKWSKTETDIPFGSYIFDIKLVDASSEPTTILVGNFNILYNSTRQNS